MYRLEGNDLPCQFSRKSYKRTVKLSRTLWIPFMTMKTVKISFINSRAYIRSHIKNS